MRKTVFFLFLLLLSLRLSAQDDPRLKFQATDGEHASVSAINEDIEGDIVVPSSVMINGRSYMVTSIAKEGFKFSKISSITLPPEMEVIGSSAFFMCKELTGIVLPPSVKEIGVDAFYYCSSLEYIQVLNGNPSFRNVGKLVVDKYDCLVAYPGKGDAVLSIQDGIKSIRRYAIGGCESIREVYIPSSVTDVDWMAFNFCRNLRRVQWDASASSVSGGCFHGCSSLEEVILSESVSSIEGMAFFGTSLKSITLLNRNPPSLDLSDDMSTFVDVTFENATVYVPEGCLEAYRSSEGWGKFAHIEETMGGGWRRSLIVSTLDGGAMEYLLDKHTKVRIDQPNLIIETDGSVLTYELESLSQIRYGRKYVTTGIHGEAIVNGQSFRMEDGALLFDNLRDNSLIEIYTVDGKAVMSRRCSGHTQVALGQLGNGVYFVKVNNETYKILKK